MSLPAGLPPPAASMPFRLRDGGSVDVPVCRMEFEAAATSIDLGSSTYNIKPQVVSSGKPLLAELAIARLLADGEWSAAWVDSFHGGVLRSAMPPDGVIQPPLAYESLRSRVRERLDRRGGAWDVLAWRRGRLAFVESKGPGDRIIKNQRDWLAAAVEEGTDPTAFGIVEWTFSNPVVAEEARLCGLNAELTRRQARPSPARETQSKRPLEPELATVLDPAYQEAVRTEGLSLVMDNSLRRIHLGRRTWPSRTLALVRRGLATDEQALTPAGIEVLNRLDRKLEEVRYPDAFLT